MTYTKEKLAEIEQQMLNVAHDAAQEYFQRYLDGVDRGCCGFAWVNVYPKHPDGRTKGGRRERLMLEALGFRKDWTGKAYEYWNPSQFPVQNIDTLEAGARAAAEYLKGLGFNAHAGSRLD